MIFTALVLGFIGSLHCLTMCGPLLLWVHGNRPQSQQILYHGSRILTYMVLGVMAGFMGKAIQWGSSQQILSLVVGALILLSVWLAANKNSSSPLSWVYQKLTRWQTRKRPANMFTWGILNGLLPCGLTYVAIAAAMTQANPWQGALYMLVFGLGTVPALTLLMSTLKYASERLRFNTNTLKYLTVLVGIMLLVRGMALGIPFISPDLNPDINPSPEITICQ